ncbi:hypothetical protein GLOIN_2v1691621 [Rhizophagus irregularis DAOM 181602=DAOM 197198]|nr:hypothetical protein GLOIN_2v1691621 [Rhizophagus irregularis DAOM 181602=DAOM 197198]
MDLNIKNSYQEKVSSKSSPEIYTPPEKNPKDLLRRNDSSISFSTSSPFNDARSFLQQSLPFRKTDAQRHLPIDINKSSKLWDWFTQTGWIKTGSNEIIQFNMN